MMTSHPPARGPPARSVGGSATSSASPPPSFAATEEDSLITWAGSGSGTHVGRAVREYSTSCLLIRYIFEITKFVFR